MNRSKVMSGLTVKVDFSDFTETLTKYVTLSRKTVKEVVGKKFRDVRVKLLKFNLETRPETVSEIKAQAPKGLKFSTRTLQRIGKSKAKLAAALEKAQKAFGTKGKRGALAPWRILKASAELQRMEQNNQQIGWAMEKKQREDAAGRAGAWGWRTKGSDFDSITAANAFAKLEKVASIFATHLQLTNTRPMSAEFTSHKGIIDKALSAVEQDMKVYIERKLSKLP
jgi:hypothetical protein